MSKTSNALTFNPNDVMKDIENIPIKYGPHIQRIGIFLNKNYVFKPHKPIKCNFYFDNSFLDKGGNFEDFSFRLKKDIIKLKIFQYRHSFVSKDMLNNICLVNCSEKKIILKKGKCIGFVNNVKDEFIKKVDSSRSKTRSILSSNSKNESFDENYSSSNSSLKSKISDSKSESSSISVQESNDSHNLNDLMKSGKMIPSPLTWAKAKNNKYKNNKVISNPKGAKKLSNSIYSEDNEREELMDNNYQIEAKKEKIKDDSENEESILNFDFNDNFLTKFKQNTLLGKKQELKFDLESLTKRYSTKSNDTCVKIKKIQKNCYNVKGGKKNKISAKKIENNLKEILLQKLEESRFMKYSLTKLWKKIDNI